MTEDDLDAQEAAFRDALARGVVTVPDPVLWDLLAGSPPKVFPDLAQLGFGVQIVDRIIDIETIPQVAAVARIARRVGLPYSEVLERWTDDDIAVEMALDAVDAARALRSCPRCGTDPEDVLDGRGRVLKFPNVVVRRFSCVVCKTVDEEREDLSPGEDVRVGPPKPGEPGSFVL